MYTVSKLYLRKREKESGGDKARRERHGRSRGRKDRRLKPPPDSFTTGVMEYGSLRLTRGKARVSPREPNTVSKSSCETTRRRKKAFNGAGRLKGRRTGPRAFQTKSLTKNCIWVRKGCSCERDRKSETTGDRDKISE